MVKKKSWILKRRAEQNNQKARDRTYQHMDLESRARRDKHVRTNTNESKARKYTENKNLNL